MNTKSLRSLLIVGCSLSAIVTSLAQAQESPSSTKAPAKISSAPEEIVVTARKRQESIFNVPVVVVAMGQQALEQSQIHDVYTLATRVPGLVIGGGPTLSGAGVSLRGIGTTVLTPTIDQSVSLNVDGLQLSQAFAYEAAMFDVGQVEVMKGPQALFFGKNSPAGVISLRSADPTDKAEIILRTGYEFEAMDKLGEAVVSGPVTDSLKLRLATQYDSNRGYFRNLDVAPVGFGVRTPTTKAKGAKDSWVVRGTALFNPSETYDARLKMNYTHQFSNYDPNSGQLGYCPSGTVSFTGLPLFDTHDNCKIDRNAYASWPDPSAFALARNGAIPFLRAHAEFGTLEQNLHFGELTATSVTGFYAHHQGTLVKGTSLGGLDPFAADDDFFNRQLTQELRLTSNYAQSPVNFMLGGFYQDGRMTQHVRLYGNTKFGLPQTLMNAIHGVDIKSVSGFGQLIWKAVDKVEIAGGVRVTHESRDHTEYNVGTPGVPVGFVSLIQPHISSTNASPEFTVTYRPTDDLTVFGSYKQGFKSGSFNTIIFYDSTTPTAFGDEAVKSGEIGLKARMLDRRLSFNLSGYYAHYTGLQVGSIETAPSGALALRTINAAAANVKGIDLDMSYSPPEIDGLTLNASANYNDARYASFPNAPCAGNQTISGGCNQLFSASDGAFHAQNLTGRPLSRAPKWMLSTGFDYEMPVGRDMTLTFGGSVAYTSHFYNNILDLPHFEQAAYAKANLNVALKGPNNAWEVNVIGNNITDKITASNCSNANFGGGLILGGQVTGKATGGPAGDDYSSCNVDRGREVWLRLTVRPLEFLRD